LEHPIVEIKRRLGKGEECRNEVAPLHQLSRAVLSSGDEKRNAGVDDGFRISSQPTDNQVDSIVSSADCGKTEQEFRKSATDCNQDNDQERLAHDKSGETEKP
jgi:hypothetical protein